MHQLKIALNKLEIFCHTFCADTHLAHLPPRPCGGKRAKPTHEQKDMPKANSRTEKNQIKISATKDRWTRMGNDRTDQAGQKQRLPNSTLAIWRAKWVYERWCI